MILLAKFCKNAANEVLEEDSGLSVSITRYKKCVYVQGWRNASILTPISITAAGRQVSIHVNLQPKPEQYYMAR